jgi:hypothetical protein
MQVIIPSSNFFKSSETIKKFYEIFGADSGIMHFAEFYAKCKNNNGGIEVQEVYGNNGEKTVAVDLKVGNEIIMLPYSTKTREEVDKLKMTELRKFI